jgi:hypothetical protein
MSRALIFAAVLLVAACAEGEVVAPESEGGDKGKVDGPPVDADGNVDLSKVDKKFKVFMEEADEFGVRNCEK